MNVFVTSLMFAEFSALLHVDYVIGDREVRRRERCGAIDPAGGVEVQLGVEHHFSMFKSRFGKSYEFLLEGEIDLG